MERDPSFTRSMGSINRFAATPTSEHAYLVERSRSLEFTCSVSDAWDQQRATRQYTQLDALARHRPVETWGHEFELADHGLVRSRHGVDKAYTVTERTAREAAESGFRHTVAVLKPRARFAHADDPPPEKKGHAGVAGAMSRLLGAPKKKEAPKPVRHGKRRRRRKPAGPRPLEVQLQQKKALSKLLSDDRTMFESEMRRYRGQRDSRPSSVDLHAVPDFFETVDQYGAYEEPSELLRARRMDPENLPSSTLFFGQSGSRELHSRETLDRRQPSPPRGHGRFAKPRTLPPVHRSRFGAEAQALRAFASHSNSLHSGFSTPQSALSGSRHASDALSLRAGSAASRARSSLASREGTVQALDTAESDSDDGLAEALPELLALEAEQQQPDAAELSLQLTGSQARAEFFNIMRSTSATIDHEGPDNGSLRSAREVYVKSCIVQKRNPVPVLNSRAAQDPHDANLAGRGLGDKLTIAYSEALTRMPTLIQRLDLSGNLIKPTGAQSLAFAIRSGACSQLLELDLSENDIDAPRLPGHTDIKGSTSIAEAIKQHKCLQVLNLGKNKLGDGGSIVIIKAATSHPSLAMLNLTSNSMGHQKTADALCSLIASGGVLKTLIISWNNFRGDAAVAISEGLNHNSVLLHLDLAWNSFRDLGAEQLGSALRENTTLKSLDLTHNEIEEKGAMVLADAVKENETLQTLILDENQVMLRGGRAIMRALGPMLHTNPKAAISIRSCGDLKRMGDVDLFDPHESTGHHMLDLASPYDVMILNDLVESVWQGRGKFKQPFGDTVSHEWEHFGTSKPTPEQLREAYHIVKPFNRVRLKADHSPDFIAEDLYKAVDTLGEGVVYLEFASSRRMPKAKWAMSPALYDRLIVMMLEPHTNSKTVPEHEHGHAMIEDGLDILTLASEECYFAADQAANLLGRFSRHQKVAAAACMYHRMAGTENLKQLTEKVLSPLDDNQMEQLETTLGDLFEFMPDNPTGHYNLKLSEPHDRILAIKLMEAAGEEKYLRFGHDFATLNAHDPPTLHDFERADGQGATFIDTSQCGNGDNWRNVYYTEPGKPKAKIKMELGHKGSDGRAPRYQDFDSSRYQLPHRGTLAFDYVSTRTPPLNAKPMSDEQFARLVLDMARAKKMVTIKVHKDAKKSHSTRRAHAQAASAFASELALAQRRADETFVSNTHAHLLESEGSLDAATSKAVDAAVRMQSVFKGKQSRVETYSSIEIHTRKKNLTKLRNSSTKHFFDKHLTQKPKVTPPSQGVAQADGSVRVQTPEGVRMTRDCWYDPKCFKHVDVESAVYKRHEIIKRIDILIRRSTLEHYFSVVQILHLLLIVPKQAYVELMVILFARTIDSEFIDPTYSEKEAQMRAETTAAHDAAAAEKAATDAANAMHDNQDHRLHDHASPDTPHAEDADEPDVQTRPVLELHDFFSPEQLADYRSRIGLVNTFNPFLPDGDYHLADLSQPEEQQILRILSLFECMEAGKQLKDEKIRHWHIDFQDKSGAQAYSCDGQYPGTLAVIPLNGKWGDWDHWGVGNTHMRFLGKDEERHQYVHEERCPEIEFPSFLPVGRAFPKTVACTLTFSSMGGKVDPLQRALLAERLLMPDNATDATAGEGRWNCIEYVG